MPKIGLLMPARERLNLNLTLISSIITSVKDINNVTLYMGIDDDDPTRETQLKIAAAIPFVKIIPIHNEGKFIGINRIWNLLAAQSTEEIFGYIGNDMIFRSKNWDEEVIKEFTEPNCPKDNIKLLYCNDARRPGDLCTNAFIHRKYYELVGYFTREEFLINWSDQWMWQIFGALDRKKFRPDIVIEHNHWCYGARMIDSTGHRMLSGQHEKISDALWHTLGPERDKELIKLSNYTGIKPDWSKVENQYRK